MKLVLDTNVLVSAMLTPFGGPSRIIELISSGEITLLLDQRIFLEYKTVLSRERFKIPLRSQNIILDRLYEKAFFVMASPLSFALPDPEDNMFVEVAVAGRADALITGNKKHFPSSTVKEVLICSPSEFLYSLKKIKN